MIEQPHVLINSECHVDPIEDMIRISDGEASPVIFQETHTTLFGPICEITAKWPSAEIKIRCVSNTFIKGKASLDDLEIANAIRAIFHSSSTEHFSRNIITPNLHKTLEGDLAQSVENAANLLGSIAFGEEKSGGIPMRVQLPSPINEGCIILRTPTAYRHGHYGNHLLEMIGRTRPHIVINKAYISHTKPYVRVHIETARTTVYLDRPDPIELMSQIARNPTLRSIAR